MVTNGDLIKAIAALPFEERQKMQEDNMRLFWTFIHERQEIFHKRYILEEPAPWTEDWILNQFKFTNVYRELDRGTLYFLEEIAPKCESIGELLFRTFTYRHYNHIPTYKVIEKMLWPEPNFDDIEYALLRLDRVYTNAHNVTGFQWAGSVSKVENSVYLMKMWWGMLDETLEMMSELGDSMEQSWDYLVKEVPGFGGFTAYEVVVDLSYTNLVSYTEDDWANPGPGCRRGLNRIYPGLGQNRSSCLSKIKELRRDQRSYFERYELPFKFYNGRELTLRNIEHCLCEFSKYAKAYYGEGRPRNNFTACSPSLELIYK